MSHAVSSGGVPLPAALVPAASAVPAVPVLPGAPAVELPATPEPARATAVEPAVPAAMAPAALPGAPPAPEPALAPCAGSSAPGGLFEQATAQRTTTLLQKRSLGTSMSGANPAVNLRKLVT